MPDPLDKTARMRCWDARDLLFACLDEEMQAATLTNIKNANLNDPEYIATTRCAPLLVAFEAACPAAWVITLSVCYLVFLLPHYRQIIF